MTRRCAVVVFLGLCSCGDEPSPTPRFEPQAPDQLLEIEVRSSPDGTPEYRLGERTTGDEDALLRWIVADGARTGVRLRVEHSIDSALMGRLVNRLAKAEVEVVEFHGVPARPERSR